MSMRPLLLACTIAAAAAALSACATDNYGRSGYSGRDRYAADCSSSGNEVAGAVVGGGVGALAGSAVAGRGNRTEGAVLGGVAGAVIGSQVAKSNNNCANAYYDGQGRRYYYDADGRPYYR
jgi:hypothetical protein